MPGQISESRSCGIVNWICWCVCLFYWWPGENKHCPINTGDRKPISQNPRCLPLSQQAVAETEIESMLKCGVIEPSLNLWASLIVLVRKKDGSTRFCVDYRRHNSERFLPLPRIDDFIDALSGSCWFSTLDLLAGLSRGAWLTEDSVHSGEWPVSVYQFTVMPFGLCNNPATFERLMEHVLAGLPWEVCLLYMDDSIVHAQIFKVELEWLRIVLNYLTKNGRTQSSWVPKSATSSRRSHLSGSRSEWWRYVHWPWEDKSSLWMANPNICLLFEVSWVSVRTIISSSVVLRGLRLPSTIWWRKTGTLCGCKNATLLSSGLSKSYLRHLCLPIQHLSTPLC